MNINFELYRIFYVVATVGNITKASHILNISQPAVTKQIKNLEAQLGGDLFIRTKRGVILTENGKEIYNYIKQGMNCFNRAEMQFSNLKQLETGVIRIGVSSELASYFLMSYLEEFHTEYPNIAIQIFGEPSKFLRKMLKRGELDILIAKELEIDEELFEIIRIGKLHHCFVASNHYEELKDKSITLNDLNSYPILLQQAPSTTRALFDSFCEKNDIEITTKLEIASITLMEEFVRIGLGVGLVTKEFAQRELEEGTIFEVDTLPKLPDTPFALITLKDAFHSFGANKLMEMILKDINKKDLQ